MFKRNESILDRIVRVTLGTVILLIGLFLLGEWQGSVIGLVVAGFGVLGLITGLTGVCPCTSPLGLTRWRKKKSSLPGACL